MIQCLYGHFARHIERVIVMSTLPAREFLDRFVNAYGQTWESLFFELTSEPECAQHMAEFIDDLERYGQQEPAYVDERGMVADGNRLVMALAILNETVEFEMSREPVPRPDQFWEIEFSIDEDEISADRLFDHLDCYLSFRVDGDWVQPLDAGYMDGEVSVTMFCPSGEYTADRLSSAISERLHRLAGVYVGNIYVSAVAVDDETAE